MNDTGQNSDKEFCISSHFRIAFIKKTIFKGIVSKIDVVQAPQYMILFSKKNFKYLKYNLGLDTICIMVSTIQ